MRVCVRGLIQRGFILRVSGTVRCTRIRALEGEQERFVWNKQPKPTNRGGHLSPLEHHVFSDSAVCVHIDSLIFITQKHLHAVGLGKHHNGVRGNTALNLGREGWAQMSLGVTKTSRSAKHSPTRWRSPPSGRPCQSCFLLHCLVLWAARASPFEKLLQQSRLLPSTPPHRRLSPKSALLTGYHGALERFGCCGSCTSLVCQRS